MMVSRVRPACGAGNDVCAALFLPLLPGQTHDAASLYGNWTAAWKHFGWLPEQFDIGISAHHPVEKVQAHPPRRTPARLSLLLPPEWPGRE